MLRITLIKSLSLNFTIKKINNISSDKKNNSSHQSSFKVFNYKNVVFSLGYIRFILPYKANKNNYLIFLN